MWTLVEVNYSELVQAICMHYFSVELFRWLPAFILLTRVYEQHNTVKMEVKKYIHDYLVTSHT